MVIDYCEFDYEIDYDEVRSAVEHVLSKYSKEKLIKLIVRELDIADELEDYFYEDIKDFYEKEAYDFNNDIRLYHRDPYDYNGVSRSEFFVGGVTWE